MPFVVDASVTLSWYFEDEEQGYAREVLRRLHNDEARVPAIWCLEIANGLLTGERRGRLSLAEVTQIAGLLQTLPIRVEDQSLTHALGSVLSLARAQGLTAYDAAYLELAMRHGVPLATRDHAITNAAARLGVALL